MKSKILRQIFISDDGKEFESEKDCLDYESWLKRYDAILRKLPKHPDTCEFTNGEGYIQHDLKVLEGVRKEFYTLAIEEIKSIHPDAGDIVPNSYGFWRYLDDNGAIGYVKGIRFLCINYENGREYGQPYFVSHESQVKDVRVN
jgi:hypothetical protein